MVVRGRVVDASAVSTPVGEFATSEDGVDGTWCATSVLGAEKNIIVLNLKLQDFELIGLSRKGEITRNPIIIEIPEGCGFLAWGYPVGLCGEEGVEEGAALAGERALLDCISGAHTCAANVNAGRCCDPEAHESTI